MRLFVRMLVIIVLFAMIGGTALLAKAAYVAIQAEEALHATLYTVELVRKYVDLHKGEWPQSWVDLETVPSPGPRFQWPESSPTLQKYVVVNFDADPLQIAKQSEDEFDAIRPAVPSYSFKKYGTVNRLIKSLSKHTSKN